MTYNNGLIGELEKKLQPAETFIGEYTASGNWNDIEKLKWNTYEVIEVMTKFLEAQTAKGGQAEVRVITLPINYEYEDVLPEGLTQEEYNAMYECSKIDFVRMFPYVELNGNRYYLRAAL